MPIKIISRPLGKVPEWVRDAWIGLTLPTTSPSPRLWLTVDLDKNRANALPLLLHLLMGRTQRVFGFAVQASTAIDLLARTQPAAAEWWRSNVPNLSAQRRYLIFDADCCVYTKEKTITSDARWGSKRFNHAYPASPGRIAVLWLIAALIRISYAMIFPADQMLGASTALYLSIAPILAALLSAWTLRLRVSTIHLIAALVMIDLYTAILALAVRYLTENAEVAYWSSSGAFILISALLIYRSFVGLRTGKRRFAAIVLAGGAYLGIGQFQATDAMFWRLSALVRPLFGQSDPFDESDTEPPQIAADVLWSAQPALVRKTTSNLLAPMANTRNVYTLAIAGSGTEALFSHEAHEALRAAAFHFGNESRGGVLLSNGRDDVMHAPLATRANIAAVTNSVAQQADARKDILFLYLVSHGSRTAELSSELYDYQPVQPISSVSIADILRKSGISRRIIVISACYSATWIPALADDNTIVITAAAKERTSFGCDNSRRITLFGQHFLSSLTVKAASLQDAFEDAKRKIAIDEADMKVIPSRPQAFVGRNMRALWLEKAH